MSQVPAASSDSIPFFVFARREVIYLSPIDARQAQETGVGSTRMPDIELVAPSGQSALVCEQEVHAWERKGWRRARAPQAVEARGRVPFGQVDWARYTDEELLDFCIHKQITTAQTMNREQRVGVLRRIGFRPDDQFPGGGARINQPVEIPDAPAALPAAPPTDSGEDLVGAGAGTGAGSSTKNTPSSGRGSRSGG